MRIVFAETPSPWLVTAKAQVSLGMLYLATILECNSYDVRYERPDSVEDFTGYGDADILCLGGTSLEYPTTLECARKFKASFPGIPIFFGGVHATALYVDVIGDEAFDAICVGEGEDVILDMVRDVKLGELEMFYMADEPIADLDTIPFPHRSLVEGVHGKSLFSLGEQYKGTESESIITSRGCPNRCAFCASKSMWGRRIRYRSVDNVIDEIRGIVESSDIRQIGIWDDTLTVNRKRCIEFCDKVAEFDIAWKCLGRAASLDKELCAALVRGGCKEIGLGFESGDQRVLDFLHKDVSVEAMLQGSSNAMEAGINVRGLFMVGTPGEQVDTPELTNDYIDRLGINAVSLFLFTPLPGSPIWDDPAEFNCEILTKDFTKYNEYGYIMENGKKTRHVFEPVVHNKFLTLDQMKDNVERMRSYIENTNRMNKG